MAKMTFNPNDTTKNSATAVFKQTAEQHGLRNINLVQYAVSSWECM